MVRNLLHLPNEVLQHILSYCDVKTAITLQGTCTAFVDLCDNLFWRKHCFDDFKTWDGRHGLQEQQDGAFSTRDWRSLYIERSRVSTESHQILNSILANQAGRIGKAHTIIQHGYDAKDALLECLDVSNDAEDVLARRSDAFSRGDSPRLT